MPTRRPLCAEASRARDEPLFATASRVDTWLLVEYRGTWARDLLGGSRLSAAVKSHLERELAPLTRPRLLFIRRPERRPGQGVVVYVARTRERGSSLRRLELEEYEDLLGLDLEVGPGTTAEGPLVVVCTHGKRDACCARFGFALYDELRGAPGPEVWQSSHVGGDRFAGNLVVLPQGLTFGRVGREEATHVVGRALAGELELEHYRGRSSYSFPVQAAEHELRARYGLTRLDDLALAGIERRGAGWLVRFRGPEGEPYEADVAAELGGEPAYLTCGARVVKRPRRYVARTRAGSLPAPGA
jgi:hypothetical protein